ncbi:hypothetical protein P7K49_013016 [Saguinus oedipus]|uniref:Uncharacterized protein n=1 Tax=Saguinus oedipus TaxID=9490 RepID=A0ABQ9VF12_SAGOE|nr:hypothetical protein P7K49_013016 [Saguinus oedipus]
MKAVHAASGERTKGRVLRENTTPGHVERQRFLEKFSGEEEPIPGDSTPRGCRGLRQRGKVRD